MTSTSDADEAPRRARRTAAPAAEGAAPAAPPARRARAAKATAPADAPPAAAVPAPARASRPRAKAEPEAGPPAAATAPKPTAASPSPSPAPAAAESTSPAPKPRAARTPKPRVAPESSAAAPAAVSPTAPAAPAAGGSAPGTGAPPAARRTRSRAAAAASDAAPSAAAPMTAAPSAAPSTPPESPRAPSAAPGAGLAADGTGDGEPRRDGGRSSRRRRRGRGDGGREPGGYARGPVPPGGDVVRPRDTGQGGRAGQGSYGSQSGQGGQGSQGGQGGYGRDTGWRREDDGRGGSRGGPADDRRGGQQGGGQQGGGRSAQPGGQPVNRYGGARSGTSGGSRYDGGRGGRFEGRGRGGQARDRSREPQRPPAGEPEDWNAPAPGGLEEGGHAAGEWVSYDDRVAGENGQRVAGQQVSGFVELSKNGNGILRAGGLAGRTDPVIPLRLLRQLGLRSGDLVDGLARGTQVVEVSQVNGKPPAELDRRPNFDQLTAVHPDKPLLIGATADNLTGRLLDIVAPVGRGQRGLIVAPPKAGKTTLLKDIANGLAHDPRLTLIICLVGERPEEVTDMRRSTSCLVLAADMDLPTEDHTRVAEICVEHAKRLVEEGRHVVILMDSLTRLARAYNLSIKGGGSRTLSGGMDAAALQPVRRFFGAARATDDGGSLTILATCLVDTGSRLDDLVYEEFKGTGNMEVHLDRKLSELRLFPAVDIRRSGTRREELLFDAKMLEQVRTLRRQLAPLEPQGALVAMLDALRKQPMPDGSMASR